MKRSDLAPWARDVAPALVVVAVASIAVSSQVSAAEGMLPLLAVIGIVAVGLAVLALHRVEMLAATQAAALPPPRLPRPGVADDEDRTAPSGPPAPLTAAQPAAAPPPAEPRKAVPPSKPMKWTAGAVRALRFEPVAMSVPKLGNRAEENEDAYAVDVGSGRVVVADGASSSFASREWSHALCAEMVSDPSLLDSAAALTAAVQRAADRWRATVSASSAKVEWWAQQGLEAGAFAALLVVEVAQVGKAEGWRAAAVGDSCLIQLRPTDGGWRLVASFPCEPGEQFGSHPDLLQSASPDETTGLRWAAGVLAAGDVLIAATDAVAELGLADPDPAVLRLLAEAGPDELTRDFTRRREGSAMVNDDCTLVRVHTSAPLR